MDGITTCSFQYPFMNSRYIPSSPARGPYPNPCGERDIHQGGVRGDGEDGG